MSKIQVYIGEVGCGDFVFSRANEDYGLLIGQVKTIDRLGTPEHDTDNDTDDIHVDFSVFDYPSQHKDEIAERLNRIFANEEFVPFVDLALDDVIMGPDMLVSLNGVSNELIYELVNGSAAHIFGDAIEEAEYTIELAEKVTMLILLLTMRRDEYLKGLLELDHERIVDAAGMISAVVDTHFYLTEHHTFTDEEADAFLSVENPLKEVAQSWYDRISQSDDFPYAITDAVREIKKTE